jgi:RNA-directed DNA polymerase
MAKQACPTRDPRQWTWVEPTVWTERMLAALVDGVKGGKWYSLWDKVCARGTLEASWEKVRENNGAAGLDGVSVERFAAQAGRSLDELEQALKAGRYSPVGVRRTYIAKRDGGRRPLGIPAVKDRIVQGALKRVLEPIFEWEFLDSSYGFRPGRGCKDALRQVDGWLKEGYPWVVDADLASYLEAAS